MTEPRPESGRSSADEEAAAVNDFLALFLRDRAAGRSRPVADYQARWPRHRERIAAEFAELTKAPRELPTIPQVELERVIGHGGQGVVYRGRQHYIDRTVAVKVLKTALADTSFAGRFRREARTLAGLTHPNIVTCYQAGVTDDGTCYIVMELVDGPTLRHWLAQNQPLPPAAALKLVRDLADALAHAHAAGTIHRDVKPDNVLLQPQPGDGPFAWKPKLVDLGLARAVLDSGLQTSSTPLGALIGSPATMAPEQFETPKLVDHRVDIYGLGCVLYHALTGKPAFRSDGMAKLLAQKGKPLGPDPRIEVSSVPAPLANLVMRMLARSPNDRPADYQTLLVEIDRASNPVPAPALAEHAPRRSRWPLVLGVLTVLGAIAAIVWWQRGQP